MNLSKNKLFLIVSLSTLIIGASIFTIFFYKTEEKALSTKSGASKTETDTAASITSTKAETDTAASITSTKAETDTAASLTNTKAETDTAVSITNGKAKTGTAVSITNGKDKSDTAASITNGKDKSDTTVSITNGKDKSDTTVSTTNIIGNEDNNPPNIDINDTSDTDDEVETTCNTGNNSKENNGNGHSNGTNSTNNNGTNDKNTPADQENISATFDVKADLNRFYFARFDDKDKGIIASLAADGSDYRVEYENADFKRSFTYSLANKRVAFINSEKKITLIDLNNRSAKPIVTKENVYCDKLMFTPNGEELICFESKDDVSNMIFFDSAKIERQEQKKILDVPPGMSFNSAFEADGKSIVFGYKKQLFRFDLETKTNSTITNLTTSRIMSAHLSSDGKLFASIVGPTGGERFINIYNLLNGVSINRPLDIEGNFHLWDLTWSKDGKRLFAFIASETLSSRALLCSLELDDTDNVIKPKPVMINENTPIFWL